MGIKQSLNVQWTKSHELSSGVRRAQVRRRAVILRIRRRHLTPAAPTPHCRPTLIGLVDGQTHPFHCRWSPCIFGWCLHLSENDNCHLHCSYFLLAGDGHKNAKNARSFLKMTTHQADHTLPAVLLVLSLSFFSFSYHELGWNVINCDSGLFFPHSVDFFQMSAERLSDDVKLSVFAHSHAAALHFSPTMCLMISCAVATFVTQDRFLNLITRGLSW